MMHLLLPLLLVNVASAAQLLEMHLFLPLLLVNVASAAQLLEHFECGTDTVIFSNTAAQFKIALECTAPVQDDTNLCCKLHDNCYDVHSLTAHTREYCDERFCNCLQDAADRAKSYECVETVNNFCALAKGHGEKAFNAAVPTNKEEKFAAFDDYQPFDLNMQSLVDVCPYAKGIAIHCHNSAVKCLAKPHERVRRHENVVEHSWEDCRSTMFDCLQMIIEIEASDTCTETARGLAKQVNVYSELDEVKYGRAIIDTYPIIAARLIKQCKDSSVTLESCFTSFDACGKDGHKDQPELYSAARKINIECHRALTACIDEATGEEEVTSEDCYEARALATSRIRYADLTSVAAMKWYEYAGIPEWLAKILGMRRMRALRGQAEDQRSILLL